MTTLDKVHVLEGELEKLKEEWWSRGEMWQVNFIMIFSCLAQLYKLSKENCTGVKCPDSHILKGGDLTFYSVPLNWGESTGNIYFIFDQSNAWKVFRRKTFGVKFAKEIFICIFIKIKCLPTSIVGE